MRIMTVQTLIDALQKLDPDKMVVVAGYEGGYDEADDVLDVRLKSNANANCWYYGDHEADINGDCEAVYIG